MVATIQFVAGINEEASGIKIRGSRNSPRKTAIFSFQQPKARKTNIRIERMRLMDDEGSFDVTDVRAQFLNGEFSGVECVYEMLTQMEFDRFMRFMERYAQETGMEFGQK
ncbi:photosystem II reaction center protein Psb28 [Candidatus Cyanaurora vandensis]|uniref:photosystem II reaction center protein Psb28 n=1 Tax=Candidatus Cyanaurora vandensis TaxID=2714958 RepID=UPI00257C5B9F|nr:photosystem II reaction center protein Psb28 [Candidatus Cyanaurora vandensis]